MQRVIYDTSRLSAVFQGDDTDFKKDNFKMTGDEGDSAKTKCQKS